MEIAQVTLDGVTVPIDTTVPPVDATLSHLGLSVSHHRRQRGWSQRRLAVRAGISPGYLYRIERGTASPSLKVIIRIASALDTHASSLLRAEISS